MHKLRDVVDRIALSFPVVATTGQRAEGVCRRETDLQATASAYDPYLCESREIRQLVDVARLISSVGSPAAVLNLHAMRPRRAA